MNDLLEKKCVPCEGGVKAFDISEIHRYQKKVDGWEIIQNDKKVYLLEKKFEFKNFLESQKFVNEVGKVSEEEGHHPDIIFGWGYAKINITTHAIYCMSCDINLSITPSKNNIWMMPLFLRDFSNFINKFLTF